MTWWQLMMVVFTGGVSLRIVIDGITRPMRERSQVDSAHRQGPPVPGRTVLASEPEPPTRPSPTRGST